VDEERILKAINCGICHVGENRVQEYLEKYDMIKKTGVKSSIIGHLQTNKVKYIADKVDLIQSVDSLKLANEIGRQAKKYNRIMDVLVEINIGGEESKFGIDESKVTELIHSIGEVENVRVKGIMSIPPVFTDEVTQRGYFEKLYKIYIDIAGKKLDNIYMDTLSMGMSNDYYYAILEGSNMIRVGTKIFGKR
jgi:pyridoxal phosphate enzyme (YggS family)